MGERERVWEVEREKKEEGVQCLVYYDSSVTGLFVYTQAQISWMYSSDAFGPKNYHQLCIINTAYLKCRYPGPCTAV